MPFPYKTRFEGRGTSMQEYGIVRIIDGKVFLCDGDLSTYLKDWEGWPVEVMFLLSEDSPQMEPDSLIWPLVKKVQACNIITLSSCQGHLDKPEQEHYPYVSYYNDDYIHMPLAEGWEAVPISSCVYRLRTKQVASTEQELEELQKSIHDQVAMLA